MPEVDILFLAGGKLEFKKGYLWLNPGKWIFEKEKNELKLVLPNAKQTDLKTLSSLKSSALNIYVSPKRIDIKKRIVVYDFPNKINFLGLIFEEVQIEK